MYITRAARPSRRKHGSAEGAADFVARTGAGAGGVRSVTGSAPFPTLRGAGAHTDAATVASSTTAMTRMDRPGPMWIQSLASILAAVKRSTTASPWRRKRRCVRVSASTK